MFCAHCSQLLCNGLLVPSPGFPPRGPRQLGVICCARCAWNEACVWCFVLQARHHCWAAYTQAHWPARGQLATALA